MEKISNLNQIYFRIPNSHFLWW